MSMLVCYMYIVPCHIVQATGSRLGTLIETMFGMTLALVIALVYSWVLTLVILGVVPLVMIAGLAEVTALSGHTAKNRKAIETAGKVRPLWNPGSALWLLCVCLKSLSCL